MPQRRIVVLSIQAILMFCFALLLLIFAASRTVSFFSCTGWLTCGDRILPSFKDQLSVVEFLYHWSIIAVAVLTPLLLIISIVVYRRDDEAVILGIRNAMVLVFVQALAAVVTSIVSLLWQGPALHWMTVALLVGATIGVVGWAMFSPNQDYRAPVFLGALLVISVIPFVPYVTNILR